MFETEYKYRLTNPDSVILHNILKLVIGNQNYVILEGLKPSIVSKDTIRFSSGRVFLLSRYVFLKCSAFDYTVPFLRDGNFYLVGDLQDNFTVVLRSNVAPVNLESCFFMCEYTIKNQKIYKVSIENRNNLWNNYDDNNSVNLDLIYSQIHQLEQKVKESKTPISFDESKYAKNNHSHDGKYLSVKGGQIIGDLYIYGNLTTKGKIVYNQEEHIVTPQHTIELGKTKSPSDKQAHNGGIVLYGKTEKSIRWNKSENCWKFIPNKIKADIIGNSDTCTKLMKPVTINMSGDLNTSFKFDGSKDISIDVKVNNSEKLNGLTKDNFLLSDLSNLDVRKLTSNILSFIKQEKVEIDASKVNGFNVSKNPSGNQIPVLDSSGNLKIPGKVILDNMVVSRKISKELLSKTDYFTLNENEEFILDLRSNTIPIPYIVYIPLKVSTSQIYQLQIFTYGKSSSKCIRFKPNYFDYKSSFTNIIRGNKILRVMNNDNCFYLPNLRIQADLTIDISRGSMVGSCFCECEDEIQNYTVSNIINNRNSFNWEILGSLVLNEGQTCLITIKRLV